MTCDECTHNEYCFDPKKKESPCRAIALDHCWGDMMLCFESGSLYLKCRSCDHTVSIANLRYADPNNSECSGVGSPL